MERKKVIVYLPARHYLMLPQYSAITPQLREFENYFLDIEDMTINPFNKGVLKDEILLGIFDKIGKIELFHLDRKIMKIIFKSLNVITYNIFNIWFQYWQLTRKILNILDEIQPVAIISCQDQGFGDLVCQKWCLKNNIQFIILQPCAIHPTTYWYTWKFKTKYFIWNKLLRLPVYPRQLYFGNENKNAPLFLWSKSFILDQSRGSTYFYGNPGFDHLFSEFSPKKPNKNKILIVTQPLAFLYGNATEKHVYEMFQEAVKIRPNIQFLVKIHPSQPLREFILMFDKKKYPNVRVIKRANIFDLFRQCDAQLTAFSNTIFEGVVTGIPVIAINPNNELVYKDDFKEIKIPVNNVQQLGPAIDKVISNEYWEEFLTTREQYCSKMFYSTDGRSGERVADQITSLINRTPNR